jgi:hypothetical protein
MIGRALDLAPEPPALRVFGHVAAELPAANTERRALEPRTKAAWASRIACASAGFVAQLCSATMSTIASPSRNRAPSTARADAGYASSIAIIASAGCGAFSRSSA